MPAFGSRALAAFPGIIAHQVVQRCLDAIEIRLWCARYSRLKTKRGCATS
jgi:hypothetical protein